MNEYETAAAVLAEAVITAIDTSHQQAVQQAVAAAVLTHNQMETDADTPAAQHVGTMVRVHVVGERLEQPPRPNPRVWAVQQGVWETIIPMIDWDRIGQHYLQRAQEDT